MIIGLLKERDDTRVALVPEGMEKLKSLGVSFLIEKGAGEASLITDEAFGQSGEMADRDSVLQRSDMIVSIRPPQQDEWAKVKKGATLVCEFQPFFYEEIAGQLDQAGLQAFSLDMIPRTTLAQSMDVLSSMASIAGYKSVLVAASELPRFFPMMITAAGSIRPAKVLILGAGVAGLQAIATARRLGAQVEAFDTRAAAKEEVESLGGRFIEIEGAKDDTSAGGYAVEQSEEFLRRQREEVQNRAMKSDVIITTAQVRGRKAPILVPKETVEKMKAGSIIVDLAASTGGNCELTKDRETVIHNGVCIIGDSNLAARMPQDASVLYSNNLVNYFKIMIKDGALTMDMDNEIIAGSLITKVPATAG
jgi:NAD(P) transhydrogenase subunit alpha